MPAWVGVEKEFRVAEIFGPTIQGEGRNVGMPCCFIRFGGCDFRCSWCDTPHAVLPELVSQLPKMTRWEIIDKLNNLQGYSSPEWVVLTGGNPGLLDLDLLIDLLHIREQKVMVETQGSTYRQWYTKVDDLCISPKPPSAGNITDLGFLDRILGKMWVDLPEEKSREDTWMTNKVYFKVPIFSDEDLDYAYLVRTQFPQFEMFLSVGNNDPSLPTVSSPTGWEFPDLSFTRKKVLDHFALILDKVLKDQRFDGCRIFPQQHVLVWGNERGR